VVVLLVILMLVGCCGEDELHFANTGRIFLLEKINYESLGLFFNLVCIKIEMKIEYSTKIK
jgi:hypothetical protein